MAATDATPPQLDMSTAISDSDHGIIVTIVCWICLVASILFYGARVHVRWPLNELFGKDDAACTVSLVLAVTQTALVLFAANGGLGVRGTELDSGSEEIVEKTVWTSDLLYILSLASSKLAIAALLHRFSAAPARIRVFRIFMYANGVYGTVGLLITALRQDILQPWHYAANNTQSNLDRWIAFGVMGIVLDVVALLSSFYLVWEVQMDRRTKATVILAFAFRAPIIVLTVLRLVALSALSADDFTWTYMSPEVYTQLEMQYSLIAATIPCLRIFLKAWHTRFLNMALEELDEQAYIQYTEAKGSYAMESLDKNETRGKGRGKGKRSTVRYDN